METAQWSDDSIIKGAVSIEIQEVGTFGSVQPMIPLIARAGHVYVCLTGNVITSDPRELFELVSTDPQNRKAVYKIKPGTLPTTRRTPGCR